MKSHLENYVSSYQIRSEYIVKIVMCHPQTLLSDLYNHVAVIFLPGLVILIISSNAFSLICEGIREPIHMMRW